jgi:hypothetical protein
MYTANKAMRDYNGKTNYENFEKWVNEKVIPNFPTPSAIVMGTESKLKTRQVIFTEKHVGIFPTSRWTMRRRGNSQISR